MVYPSERLRLSVVIRYIFLLLKLKQLIKFLITVSKLPGDKIAKYYYEVPGSTLQKVQEGSR